MLMLSEVQAALAVIAIFAFGFLDAMLLLWYIKGEYYFRKREARNAEFTFVQGVLHVKEYTNWKGEKRRRAFYPLRLYYGSNEWHKEPQWLLDAMDHETGLERTFALEGFD